MKTRLSFGFLEAEYRGAHRPNGGNPGLWRESGPRPPTWVGAGAQGPKSWDAMERKRPTVPLVWGHPLPKSWDATAAGRLAGLLAGWLARRPAGWKAATTLRVVGCEGLSPVDVM